MLVDEIKIGAPEDVSQNMQDNFVLHWHPNFDTDWKKHNFLMSYLKEKFKNKRNLEIGYRWNGRFFYNSKVLDLYDPRVDIDYRVDICDAKIIPNESFDFISCFSVLEHIPKFWKAAEEIQRILVKDGILFCCIPACWPYHPTCGEGQNMGGDYWRSTHEGLVSLFDKLEKITVFYSPPSNKNGEHLTFGWGLNYVGIKR